MNSTFFSIIKHPRRTLRRLLFVISPLIFSDALYLKCLFRLSMQQKLNLKNPRTFNEKLQWLKIWSKDKGFNKYVDKLEVRSHIKEILGEEYLIPILGKWNKFDDIDFASLPNQFVLKTTHDSGGVVVCKDKSNFNFKAAKQKLQRRLKHNYFWRGREYAHKYCTPRIIAEKFMVDESGWDLKDYKFFCFNGEPKILFLASERFKKEGVPAHFDYYDMNLNHLNISSRGHKTSEHNSKITVPNFEAMKEVAAKLSKGFPFIRIDLYNINGQIYFGEMTFFHDGGIVPFEPEEWDLKLGEMIELPKD